MGVSFVSVMCTLLCMCRYVLHGCVDTVCMGEYCTYVWICMYICVDTACMGEHCTYVWILEVRVDTACMGEYCTYV